MYSKRISELIKKAGVGPRDEVIVETQGKLYEGVLMPSSDFGNPDCLVLKLDNGYDVGLRYDATMTMRKSPAAAPSEVEAEVDLELGKLSRVPKLDFDPKKPAISLITTGGTITSRVDYKTGGVTSLMSPQELLNVAPELVEIVNLKDVVNPFNKMSENYVPSDWQRLAEVVAKELNRTEGVIVTHGTDTLHFTAAALSFMLKGLSKPVVLVGAQKSSDRGSSDAAMNLICAARVAAYSDAAEVGICMHGTMSDDYCIFTRGTKVRKMHTSRRDTFRPINDVPIMKVWPDGKTEQIKADYRRRSRSEVVADTSFEPKTALVRAYPGADPAIIDFYVDHGYRGLVIEATGLGQVPASWLPSIERAVEKQATVCFAPQTIYGRLNPYVYAEARKALELGVIYLEDMLPETAYVKLGCVLGRTADKKEIAKMMLTNIAGEMTDRTLPESFLY